MPALRALLLKNSLFHYAALRVLNVTKNEKEELFDLLCNNGFEYKQFADLFGIGVSSQVYQSAFNITHQDVKRLERNGVLKK